MTDNFFEQVFGTAQERGVGPEELAAAAYEEVEAQSSRTFTSQEIAFRERVSRYPFEYMIANAIGDGNPKEVMTHLHLYGTSDKAKEMLGRFLAALPSGMDLGHAEQQINFFLAADSTVRANAADLLSRAVIYVNRYNAQDLLTQFVAWVPMAPTPSDLAQHRIPVRSAAGNYYIDYSDSTTLFNSVAELLIAREAGKKKFKYLADPDEPLYHALVYFLMLSYRVQIEDGKYTVSRNYHGDRQVPRDWVLFAEQLAIRLRGRAAAGSLIFQQDARASLYSDICKMMENDTTIPNRDKVRQFFAKYSAYCISALKAIEYSKQSLDAAVQKAVSIGFPPIIFDKKVKAENDLHEIRSANMENFDLIYGEKNLGFDYPHIPSHAFGALTVLYQCFRAVCMMTKRNFKTEWSACLQDHVVIILCGQDVANRATILESICQLIGWGLVVSNQRPVKLGNYAQRMPQDKEWGSVAMEQVKLKRFAIVYWIGMKDVEILENIPNPPEGTEEDKAILQTLFNYGKLPSPAGIALLVHHDVMKTPKFTFEMVQLKERKLTMAMVPHPASDATGVTWIVLPPGTAVDPEATPQFVWSHKLIESTSAKVAVSIAIGAGCQRQPPSVYLNTPLTKFLITAIQWQRVKLRQAGTKVYDDKTEKNFKEIFTEAAPPPPDVDMSEERSPAHKKRYHTGKELNDFEKICFYLTQHYDEWDYKRISSDLRNLELTFSVIPQRAFDIWKALNSKDKKLLDDVLGMAAAELKEIQERGRLQ